MLALAAAAAVAIKPSAAPDKSARLVMTTSSTKKLRHPSEKLIAPPMVGPMFGAKPIAMPATPMAVA